MRRISPHFFIFLLSLITTIGQPKLQRLSIVYDPTPTDRKMDFLTDAKYLISKPENGVTGLSRESRHGIQSTAILISKLASQLTDLDISIIESADRQNEIETPDFQMLWKAITECTKLRSLRFVLISPNINWGDCQFADLRVLRLNWPQLPSDEGEVAKSVLKIIRACDLLEELELPEDLDFETRDLVLAFGNLRYLQKLRIYMSDARDPRPYLAGIRAVSKQLRIAPFANPRPKSRRFCCSNHYVQLRRIESFELPAYSSGPLSGRAHI